jgi:hypothetical protein
MDLDELFSRIRQVAIDYYKATGKPLGVTGEVAEYEASEKLGLELCDAREPGCDAIRRLDGRTERISVKGRWFKSKPNPGARVGKIDFKHEWDSGILVILDELYSPVVMHEAPRDKLLEVLTRPGSKSRTERGQMSISQFKAVGRVVWDRPRGRVDASPRPADSRS